MNKTLQIRIDTKTKEGARKVFAQKGLDVSTGVRMFLTRVSETGEIPFLKPFSFDSLPEKRKKELMREAKLELKHGHGYASVKALLDDILAA